jgi:uncharacterized protein (DUF433 family)
MEYIADRITLSPDLCNGKPTIRGMRITVKTILDFISAGEEVKEILYQFPDLEQADIDACLKFAANLMDRNYVIKEICCLMIKY